MSPNLAKKILCLLAGSGIIVSTYLVVSEISAPPFCPRVFNIPACYMVLLSFSGVFISQFLKQGTPKQVFLWGGNAIGIGLAIWFSITHILQINQCPLAFNIPLCYVSLATFVTIVILHLLSQKK